MNWRTSTILLLNAMVGASCSLAFEVDPVQCEVSADCAALGNADLQCIDAVCVDRGLAAFECRSTPWPPLSTESVQVSVVARSLTVEQPVPGLAVKACDTLIDPDCLSPRGEAVTDSTGVARLDVAQGFRGHFFVPASEGVNAPYVLHMMPPPDPQVPSTLQGSLTITNLPTMREIAGVGGVQLLDGRGHLFFTALGCDYTPLPGVVVAVADAPEGALVAYLGANGLPDQSLQRTSTTGLGVAINLPPGFVTVRAYHEEVGQLFEQVFYVAADTITSSQVVPSVF